MLKERKKQVKPAFWVPTAYFAMGLPFIAINLVSVFMFKDLGVSDTQIAFWTSLIMMPWTLKFLWSPFLEMYRTKKFFVVITQLTSGVLFGIVAFSLFFDYFFAISISTMAVIAFSGATHDIACDGVYMAELDKETQAKYIGVQGAFYNVAKLVANGGLVALAGALAEHFGAIEGASLSVNKEAYLSAWMIIFGVIGAVMVLIGMYHIRVLPSTQVPSTAKKTSREVRRELVAVIANFFTKKHILYYIGFIILYRLGEGFIMKIAPLFLRASRDVGGLGLTLTEIGTLNGVFGSGAFVLGSLLAGIYVSRFGLKRTLFTLCCVFNLPFMAYTFLAVTQPTNLYLIGSCITLEYFGYGFGFVGLILFMMQQIAPGKHQMSHYAFASGIMNLGVMLPGMASGYFSDLLGYRDFFIYVLIATIPAFLITYFIPFTYDDSKKKQHKNQ
ncbi:MFS transporter [Maribellus luteus]|uniref:MFS transporter n=1 Tax=Maribellus luteus TaxID=2305463 RepID=A0A399SVI8_9BACT|nr:MFS transporter [Maribellus luteus]RIJ45957.1 MFS transporter [Maribellus luteus]